jgi:alpha,alpha-trehalase
MKPIFFDIDYQIANTLYGKLFHQVQFSNIFPDSKTFPDCTPKRDLDEILIDFGNENEVFEFDLKAFVFKNFNLTEIRTNDFKANIENDLNTHIYNLWPYLTISKIDLQGTYLPLPKPFIVPGGRFQELYYWDSYFTCLGLMEHKKYEEVENLIENFAYLIDNFGYIPNANRSYFMSRSQPPFFALLVDLLSKEKGENFLLKYLPTLLKEYNFWNDGIDELSEKNISNKRAVSKNDSILNRYWDKMNTPRPESYREDIELAEKIIKNNTTDSKPTIYRNIRAAAESGWDFSARWFADGENMETIETIDILPVDLNCLIYFLETKIAEGYQLNSEVVSAKLFFEKAENRKKIIQELFWNDGFFYDFNFVKNDFTKLKTLAACFPLFFKIATESQAKSVSEIIEKDFLKAGGVVTSLTNSGQQWDWPNGWAPLQWITYKGLINYGFTDLAEKIRKNWLKKVETIYKKEGKLTEKYDVVNSEEAAGGGEYPNQDGFGWTNGVTLMFLKEENTKNP